MPRPPTNAEIDRCAERLAAMGDIPEVREFLAAFSRYRQYAALAEQSPVARPAAAACLRGMEQARRRLIWRRRNPTAGAHWLARAATICLVPIMALWGDSIMAEAWDA